MYNASSSVVVVGKFSNLQLWIDRNLEEICSWPDVSDIDPLTINVVMVGVDASYGYTLVPVVGTCILFGNVGVALVVLQAETGFVALGYLVASGIDNVEVGEHLHAVVMEMTSMPLPCLFR